jgi:hypothetical protein
VSFCTVYEKHAHKSSIIRRRFESKKLSHRFDCNTQLFYQPIHHFINFHATSCVSFVLMIFAFLHFSKSYSLPPKIHHDPAKGKCGRAKPDPGCVGRLRQGSLTFLDHNIKNDATY